MRHGTAARCRLERLSKNPHSLENIEALAHEIQNSLPKLPKSVQLYLDSLLDFTRDKSHEMTLANMGLVGKVVNHYYFSSLIQRKISLDDASQEGAIALMHAAMLYDFSRGFQFSTYAVGWIMQVVRRLMQRDRLVVVPNHFQEKRTNVEETRARERYGDKASRAMDVVYLSAMKHDSHLAGGEGSPGENTIVDRKNLVGGDALDARIDVEDLMRCLPEREKVVVRLRFLEGLDLRVVAEKLAEMGFVSEMGGERMSRERVRQLQVTALEKMRRRAEQLQRKVGREK